MRLSRRAAFWLQASIIAFFLAGSSAPTPLYAVYQRMWGFTPITITVVFGIYAIAVLAALLVAGSLSDYVGRRPVLFAAAIAQVATMVVFATASGVGSLIAARVLQGLATGAAASAVGAGMLDIDRERGTIANSVGPMLGTASGALMSGLVVAFLPAPTVLVYVVLAAIFVAQAIGVALMPETITPRPGALASLRPRFQLPSHVRRPLLLAAPALVAAWALIGFYGSLGPALVRRVVGVSSGPGAIVLGGLSLFTTAAAGALASYVFRAREARSLLRIGTATLVAGVATTLVAVASDAPIVLFVGAALSGAGFGTSFQGAIRSVMPLAAPHERAGVLSFVYLIAYLAMGLPAVLGGVRVVYGGGVVDTTREYGIAVMILAALAHLGTRVRARAFAVASAR